MKKHLIAAAVLIVIGAGCVKQPLTAQEYSYHVDFRLLSSDKDGNENVVPLDLKSDDPWAPTHVVVSPDKRHVAYAEWENAHYLIKLADLPNGDHVRTVAEQGVPEGHGGLRADTLTWIDEHTLFYQEASAPCGETGEPVVLNPTKSCDGTIILTYHVDTETDVKTMADRWMEVIKPLKP